MSSSDSFKLTAAKRKSEIDVRVLRQLTDEFIELLGRCRADDRSTNSRPIHYPSYGNLSHGPARLLSNLLNSDRGSVQKVDLKRNLPFNDDLPLISLLEDSYPVVSLPPVGIIQDRTGQ